MAPIEADFTDYEPNEKAQPKRPGRDCGLHAVRDHRVGGPRDDRERKSEEQTRHQAADEVVAKILNKRLPKELLRMQGEQPLKRKKDQREKQQPRAKPSHVYQERQKMLQIQKSGQSLWYRG